MCFHPGYMNGLLQLPCFKLQGEPIKKLFQVFTTSEILVKFIPSIYTWHSSSSNSAQASVVAGAVSCESSACSFITVDHKSKGSTKLSITKKCLGINQILCNSQRSNNFLNRSILENLRSAVMIIAKIIFQKQYVYLIKEITPFVSSTSMMSNYLTEASKVFSGGYKENGENYLSNRAAKAVWDWKVLESRQL